MALTSIRSYDNPSNYTFDSALIEVSSGARLLDQRPSGAIFYHNFSQNDGAWGVNGTGIVLDGDASISGGELILPPTAGTRLVTDLDVPSAIDTKGTIRFKYTPNYTGNPSSIFYMATLKDDATDANQIQLFHDTASALRLNLRDSSNGVVAVNVPFGTLSMTAGTTYEFELNFDCVLGFWKLFVDGVAQGSEYSFTYSRAGANTKLFIGTSFAPPAQIKYDDLILFNTVQHTVDYTPGEVISDTIYPTSAPLISANSPIVSDGIISFAASNTNARFIASFSGAKKWWNGSVWIDSDGTEAQSNTLTDYNDNITTLDLGDGSFFRTDVLLTSDGFTQSEILETTTVYDFDFVSPEIDRCIVYGRVSDHCDIPVAGAKITVSGDDFFHSNTLVTINCSTFTNSNGEFEISVIETATVGTVVDITVEYKENGTTKTFKKSGVTIPNQSTVRFEDL